MGDAKFKMPTKSDLKGRSSTISNAFTISITPYISPTDDQVADFYKALDIQEGQCAYCLGDGNGRDHLKPLVRNGMPTGYITDINNLVPCCQACNSSKGAKDFQTWYLSPKNIKRLKSRGLTETQINHRFNVVSQFENKIGTPIDYESIVGHDLWEEFNARRKAMIQQLQENQRFCDTLQTMILEAINHK